MTVLGIDLGTSSIKAVLLDGDRVVASAEALLPLSQPRPQWSEQSPHDWWTAFDAVVATLRLQAASVWSEIARKRLQTLVLVFAQTNRQPDHMTSQVHGSLSRAH